GRRGKAQPLAKHLRLEQKCARRTLTLNRQSIRFKCEGLELSTSTLAD
ncbi:hypothetical protein GOC82_32990, partial [Sinorhizobium medicae]|nr:hypothetical protein [Sinorhizobium medicae]MDX0907681.1 hypothetical protein [Sinorhizobium medicae]